MTGLKMVYISMLAVFVVVPAAFAVDTAELYDCMKGRSRFSLTVTKEALISCGADPSTWFEELRDLTAREQSEDSSSDAMFVTDVYNSKSFYIFSRIGIFEYLGVGLCSDHSGYLVEINDEGEFLFIEKELKALHSSGKGRNLRYIDTGTYYRSLSAPWEFRTHSQNKDVYVGHWGSGEPHRNSMENNGLLLIDDNSDGNLYMADGHYGRHLEGCFLCEVSKEV